VLVLSPRSWGAPVAGPLGLVKASLLRRRPMVARRGTVHVMRYLTRRSDSVQDVGPGREWSDKPPVVASFAVIRLCEQVCMTALLDTMPGGHCSLGSVQQLVHCGPIAIGAEIEITVRCTRSRGRHSRWQVTVRDAHEVVGRGWMEFVVVDRPRFEERRLTPKRALLKYPAA